MVGPGRLRSFAHPTQESDLPQLIVGRSAGLGIMSPGFVCHGACRPVVLKPSQARAMATRGAKYSREVQQPHRTTVTLCDRHRPLTGSARAK